MNGTPPVPTPIYPDPLTPGYQTTEFLTTLGTAAFTIVGALWDSNLAAVVQAVLIGFGTAAVVAYTGIRAWLKSKQATATATVSAAWVHATATAVAATSSPPPAPTVPGRVGRRTRSEIEE